jgi:hypothetical protein
MADLSVPLDSAGCSSGRATGYFVDSGGGGGGNSSDINSESTADKSGQLPDVLEPGCVIPSPKQQFDPADVYRHPSMSNRTDAVMPSLEELRMIIRDLMQTDDVVRDLVKTELKESSRESSEPTVAREAAHTSVKPCEDISPKAHVCKPYQATVEDGETEFEDISSCEGGGMTPDSVFAVSPILQTASTDLPTPASSVSSESVSSATSGGAPWPPKINTRLDEKPSALRSPDLTEPKSKANVRWSNRPPIILHGRVSELSPTTPSRPLLGERNATDPIHSTADLQWGQLFDVNGHPTKRFEDVLRGVANYLITQITPNDSVVITPEKLCRFYDMCSQQPEIVPFHYIFDCSSKDDFKDLEYLPYIPALTVQGFRDWMTLLLRAYPEVEAKRLSSIFEKFSIDVEGQTPFGDRERLPKQLSRYLLPAMRHEPTYGFVSNNIEKWKREARFKDSASSGLPSPSHKTSSHPTSIVVASSGPKDYLPSQEMEKYRLEVQRVPINRSSSYTNEQNHLGAAKEYERAPVPERRGRQGPDLMPPPIGIHHSRKRSPLEQFRNREPPGRLSGPNNNYYPSRDRPSANEGTLVVRSNSSMRSAPRWSREDEYRYLQGRDTRVSLDGPPARLRRGS